MHSGTLRSSGFRFGGTTGQRRVRLSVSGTFSLGSDYFILGGGAVDNRVEFYIGMTEEHPQRRVPRVVARAIIVRQDQSCPTEPADRVNVPDSARALAAVELVAVALELSTANLPDDVADWLTRHRPAVRSLGELAIRALERLQAGAELLDLWNENGHDVTMLILIDQMKRGVRIRR